MYQKQGMDRGPRGSEAMSDFVERLLEEVIDATFMQRGFQARAHREAILAALDDAGYAVLPKPADEISRLFEEAEVEELRAALKPFADLYDTPWTDNKLHIGTALASDVSELRAIKLSDVVKARLALGGRKS
jgi:hypothetical protein